MHMHNKRIIMLFSVSLLLFGNHAYAMNQGSDKPAEENEHEKEQNENCHIGQWAIDRGISVIVRNGKKYIIKPDSPPLTDEQRLNMLEKQRQYFERKQAFFDRAAEEIYGPNFCRLNEVLEEEYKQRGLEYIANHPEQIMGVPPTSNNSENQNQAAFEKVD